jgi:hypothetical protein
MWLLLCFRMMASVQDDVSVCPSYVECTFHRQQRSQFGNKLTYGKEIYKHLHIESKAISGCIAEIRRVSESASRDRPTACAAAQRPDRDLDNRTDAYRSNSKINANGESNQHDALSHRPPSASTPPRSSVIREGQRYVVNQYFQAFYKVRTVNAEIAAANAWLELADELLLVVFCALSVLLPS